jgi:hypothetical protein
LFLWIQHSNAVAGYHGFNPGNDAIVMGCSAPLPQRPAVFRGQIAGCASPGRLRGYRSRPKMPGCIARDLVASFYDGLMKPAEFRYEYKYSIPNTNKE